MKITLCSIGKPHDPNLQKAIDDFTQRISNYFPVEWLIVPPPKNAAVMNIEAVKKAEGSAVMNHISKEDFLVLLDERGKNISSPELANLLQQKANESTKRLVFLIGGAFGVDDLLTKRAQFTWSFSKLVFPHMIARLVLAEQIYRACTILRNEKYHHV